MNAYSETDEVPEDADIISGWWVLIKPHISIKQLWRAWNNKPNDILTQMNFKKLQLTENGYKTIFNSYNKTPIVAIYDATSKKIFNILACNYTNIFKFWIQKCKINEINKINNYFYSFTDNYKNNNNYIIWHKRLGHFWNQKYPQ